eukprot:902012-Pelagomonas_calceolata.AAC.13
MQRNAFHRPVRASAQRVRLLLKHHACSSTQEVVALGVCKHTQFRSVIRVRKKRDCDKWPTKAMALKASPCRRTSQFQSAAFQGTRVDHASQEDCMH